MSEASESAQKRGPFGTDPQPRIANRCPNCGGSSLFIGVGGWLTCSNLTSCREPSLDSAIERRVQESNQSEREKWIEAIRLAHYWLTPPSGEPNAKDARDVLRNALHAAGEPIPDPEAQS